MAEKDRKVALCWKVGIEPTKLAGKANEKPILISCSDVTALGQSPFAPQSRGKGVRSGDTGLIARNRSCTDASAPGLKILSRRPGMAANTGGLSCFGWTGKGVRPGVGDFAIVLYWRSSSKPRGHLTTSLPVCQVGEEEPAS